MLQLLSLSSCRVKQVEFLSRVLKFRTSLGSNALLFRFSFTSWVSVVMSFFFREIWVQREFTLVLYIFVRCRFCVRFFLFLGGIQVSGNSQRYRLFQYRIVLCIQDWKFCRGFLIQLGRGVWCTWDDQGFCRRWYLSLVQMKIR